MKFGFVSRNNLKNPLLIAIVIVAIAIGGSLLMKHQAPRAQAPDLAMLESTGVSAPVVPDYSVTSSPAIRWEDELTGQVTKTVYKCANGEYFTARVEVTGTSSAAGKAEVFLKDYSKVLLTQTMSASGVRYENAGGSFVLWTKGDTAFIEEGERVPYPDCVAQ